MLWYKRCYFNAFISLLDIFSALFHTHPMNLPWSWWLYHFPEMLIPAYNIMLCHIPEACKPTVQ